MILRGKIDCIYYFFFKKMFVEVDPSDMVVGVKYALLTRCDLVTYSIGTLKYRQGTIQFHYLKQDCIIENTYMYNEIRRIQGMNKIFRFYAFVPKKEKIQQAMEKRALDKILKRVINDDFTW